MYKTDIIERPILTLFITNEEKLIHAITEVVAKYNTVYIPYKIGCEHAGGNWNKIYDAIKYLPIRLVKPKTKELTI